MRTNDIIGKTIVGVRQGMTTLNGGLRTNTVDALILDDGSELRTHAHETESEPTGTILHVKPPKDQRPKSPTLLKAIRRFMKVAIWDDEFTTEAEFNRAYDPLKAMVDKIGKRP